MGISLGDLRFADDVLLFSAQKYDVRLQEDTESVGLKIHPDKTTKDRTREKK